MKIIIMLLGVLILTSTHSHAEVLLPPVAVEEVQAVADVQPIEVGNKICPVSGGEVGGMGDPFKKEYKGKIYSLCCGACEQDFDKDPDKYAKIADDEVAPKE